VVPLKQLDGFDAALSSLEMLVAAPEQILWRLMSLGSALPDGGQLEARLVHFDPP
jgi:hypothetical protein